MKKYFVLIAVAMIALAGCKKEETGMVTLKVGAENATNFDKQTYNVQLNRIMFNNGETMLINGGEYDIQPSNEDNDAYTTEYNSYKASLEVPATALYGRPFLAVYPSTIFTENVYDADNDVWAIDEGLMLNDCNMICDVNADDVQGNILLDGQYRAWPMVAYDVCGTCIAQEGQFRMKNTVAILSPAFIYGMNWFRAMNDDYGLGYDTRDGITSASQLPAVEVERVVITSSSEPLSGNAYVAGLTTAEPKLVMDEPAGENTLTLTNCGTYSNATNPNFINPNIIGQIPVAPFVGRTHLTMTVFFTIGQDHFKYQGDPVQFTSDMTVRNVRTILQINMRDDNADNMRKFTRL